MAAQAAPERLTVECYPEVEISETVNVEVEFDAFEAGKIIWFMDKTGLSTYAEAVRALCMCGLGFTLIDTDPQSGLDTTRTVFRLVIALIALATGGLIDHETGW